MLLPELRIKLKKKKLLSAVTLVETIVVLMIVALISVLGHQGHEVVLKNNEQAFWQKFDNAWKKSLISVQGTNEVITFYFEHDRLSIRKASERKWREIPYPKTLYNVRTAHVILVNGSISGRNDIGIKSTINNQMYIISWSLGWGVYEIKPNPKGLYRS